MLSYFIIVLTLLLSPVALVVVTIIFLSRFVKTLKAKKEDNKTSEVSNDEKE